MLTLGHDDDLSRRRRDGAAVLVLLTFAAGCLAVRNTAGPVSVTIYPWWSCVLLGAGLLAAGAAVRSPVSAAVARAWSPVVVVVASQLVGLGVVAVKHWRPAVGMGSGGWSDEPVSLLQAVAALLAASAAGALAVAGVDLLRRWRVGEDRPSARARAVCTAAGAAVVVLLPPLVALGDVEARDLTSLGAVGLLSAGPWGVALAASGVLPRRSGVAVAAAVAASVVLALIGPQMAGLLHPEPRVPFAAVLAAALVVLRVLVRDGARPDEVTVRAAAGGGRPQPIA